MPVSNELYRHARPDLHNDAFPSYQDCTTESQNRPETEIPLYSRTGRLPIRANSASSISRVEIEG
ncbi:hypothetical protein VI817_006555 [Penicillium citrinum]|nr:hypothetical protein VI817_006555 [Penicillium citrinum]